jgi:hypothetical protein
MGMNTGLQDAANLGWKLAAAVHGWGTDALLDTYQDERYPVGRRVLRASDGLLRLALPLVGDPRRARRAGSRHYPHRSHLQATGGYRVGNLHRLGGPRGAHRLVGRRAPDVRLTTSNGSDRLYEALRRGRLLLVTPPNRSLSVAGWEEHVDTATTTAARRTTILVRPDGYIAWAADDTPQSNTRKTTSPRAHRLVREALDSTVHGGDVSPTRYPALG